MATVTPVDLNSTPLQTKPLAVQATTNKQLAISEAPAQQEVKAQPEVETKVAEMVKREMANRDAQRARQAEKRAYQQQQQELAQIKAELERERGFRSKLAQSPWDAMLEAGLTPEQATQAILNQPRPEDVKFTQLQQEIESLKNAQKQTLENQAQASLQQEEQVKKQITTEVKMMIEEDPQSFETIKAQNAQEAVTEYIKSVFDQTGYLMPLDQAAKEVEDYLVDQALGLAKLTKVQSRLQSQSEPTQAQLQKSQPTQKSQSQVNTLSNRVVQSTTQPLNARERRERAILAFQGKL